MHMNTTADYPVCVCVLCVCVRVCACHCGLHKVDTALKAYLPRAGSCRVPGQVKPRECGERWMETYSEDNRERFTGVSSVYGLLHVCTCTHTHHAHTGRASCD